MGLRQKGQEWFCEKPKSERHPRAGAGRRSGPLQRDLWEYRVKGKAITRFNTKATFPGASNSQVRSNPILVCPTESFADDLCTGQGVVSSRAESSLRSTKTLPDLAGGFRLVYEEG